MWLFSRKFIPKTFPPVINIADERNLPFLDHDYSNVFKPPAFVDFIANSK